MRQTPIAHDQTALMAGYIEGFEEWLAICPSEMSDLPGFLSGHQGGRRSHPSTSMTSISVPPR
jgi:hypothetical protein